MKLEGRMSQRTRLASRLVTRSVIRFLHGRGARIRWRKILTGRGATLEEAYQNANSLPPIQSSIHPPIHPREQAQAGGGSFRLWEAGGGPAARPRELRYSSPDSSLSQLGARVEFGRDQLVRRLGFFFLCVAVLFGGLVWLWLGERLYTNPLYIFLVGLGLCLLGQVCIGFLRWQEQIVATRLRFHRVADARDGLDQIAGELETLDAQLVKRLHAIQRTARTAGEQFSTQFSTLSQTWHEDLASMLATAEKLMEHLTLEKSQLQETFDKTKELLTSDHTGLTHQIREMLAAAPQLIASQSRKMTQSQQTFLQSLDEHVAEINRQLDIKLGHFGTQHQQSFEKLADQLHQAQRVFDTTFASQEATWHQWQTHMQAQWAQNEEKFVLNLAKIRHIFDKTIEEASQKGEIFLDTTGAQFQAFTQMTRATEEKIQTFEKDFVRNVERLRSEITKNRDEMMEIVGAYTEENVKQRAILQEHFATESQFFETQEKALTQRTAQQTQQWRDLLKDLETQFLAFHQRGTNLTGQLHEQMSHVLTQTKQDQEELEQYTHKIRRTHFEQLQTLRDNQRHFHHEIQRTRQELHQFANELTEKNQTNLDQSQKIILNLVRYGESLEKTTHALRDVDGVQKEARGYLEALSSLLTDFRQENHRWQDNTRTWLTELRDNGHQLEREKETHLQTIQAYFSNANGFWETQKETVEELKKWFLDTSQKLQNQTAQTGGALQEFATNCEKQYKISGEIKVSLLETASHVQNAVTDMTGQFRQFEGAKTNFLADFRKTGQAFSGQSQQIQVVTQQALSDLRGFGDRFSRARKTTRRPFNGSGRALCGKPAGSKNEL